MYEQTLIQTGLTQEQATVYEVLLKNGPSPARKVAQNTPFKRSLVYKILDDLGKLGLVTRKDEIGKVSVFEPAHPVKLRELAEVQEQKAKTAQAAIDGVLSQLTSDFNLISDKPGVKFYEGIDGAKKILFDSLSKGVTEIYSYIDNEAVNKYYPKLNEEYVRARGQQHIKKKMITIDSEYIRTHAKRFNPETTELRVIPKSAPFTTVMQIYGNKVSYLSINKKQVIGIIIDHPQIAQMHKTLFESLWATATPLVPPAVKQPRPSPSLPALV